MKASVILLLAAMCCGGALFSQTYAEIDTNNIRVGFNHSGDMLTNLNGGSGLSAPTSGNTISFSVANLWLGGLDAGGQLHVAAQTYRQVGTDFWPGPLDTINACSFSSDVVASGMNRLWEITQAEIDAFVYCMNTSTSGCPVPQSILDWPGNGNQFYNQGIHLAPFHDADGDGVYNPSAGDYPVIRGDKAVYFIYNDANCALTHGETQGQRLSVEIHGLAYAYDCADSALANTVFIHYRIINRSTHTYNSTYIGHWSDIDLGTFSDDRVGSDSLLHAYYFYDGGDDAWGAVFLNQPMSRAMSYANNFTGTGNPSTADDYYELLRSIYPDGTPLTYNSMSTPTTHIFTGDPYLQTGWLDSPTSPADKRILGSTGPFTLAPGAGIELDMAYVFARDYTNTPYKSTQILRQRMQDLRNYYASNTAPCNANLTHAAVQTPAAPLFRLYPVPASETLSILTNENFRQLEVRDALGRLVKIFPGGTKEIDVRELQTGVYVLMLVTEEGNHLKLFVKH